MNVCMYIRSYNGNKDAVYDKMIQDATMAKEMGFLV